MYGTLDVQVTDVMCMFHVTFIPNLKKEKILLTILHSILAFLTAVLVL